mgnify:CR=1 FL=1
MTIEERNKLVEENLGLVGHICTKVYPSCLGDNFDDFFQIGCLGLVEAADNYDPSTENQFSTYAYKFIAGRVSRAMKHDYMRHNGVVSLDAAVREQDLDSLSLVDMVEDETVRSDFDQAEIEEARFLATLNERQQYIWNRRKEEKTIRDIAQELGCTHQAVQQQLVKMRKLYSKFSRLKGER